MSERLIDYLRRNYGDAHSARALKRMIDQGWCRVNDCVERHSTRKLRPSDCVTLHIQTAASKTRSWETGRVLFEDDHLVIYNKPAGISSDGATGLEAFAQERQLILLNRLDKDTTGALLFAKSTEAQAAVIELFRARTVEKHYLALVDGCPLQDDGEIESYLAPIEILQGQKRWGSVDETKGKHALTRWQVEERLTDASLIRCELVTGRTHQLRVHLSELGHPILGDALYGRRTQSRILAPRLLLHAHRIAFIHPFSKEQLCVEAPLPTDFLDCLKEGMV